MKINGTPCLNGLAKNDEKKTHKKQNTINAVLSETFLNIVNTFANNTNAIYTE